MPLFFFDFDGDPAASGDDEGTACRDIEEARHHAIRALAESAKDLLPNGDDVTFTVQVRGETGQPVFRASLVLHSEWIEPALSSAP